MKLPHGWVWVLALLFPVLTLGCQGEDLDALEIVNKSDAALQEANSCAFDITVAIDQALGAEAEEEIMDVGTEFLLSGVMTFEPYTMHMEMTSEALGMDLDTETYLVDDTIFFFIPEMGWMQEPAQAADVEPSYQDPMEYFGYMDLLREADGGNVEVKQEGDYFLLDYDDASGIFAELLTDQMKEEMAAELDDMPELSQEMEEMAEGIDFSDVTYHLKIDRHSFLPAEIAMGYTLGLAWFGESTTVANSIHATFSDYGEIDEISVPEEVREEADAADDWF